MNLLLTTYHNKVIDKQRSIIQPTSIEPLLPLIKSIKNEKLIIFSDCLNQDMVKDYPYVEIINTTSLPNVYFNKLYHPYNYLSLNKDNIDNILVIDATDVIQLNQINWNIVNKFFIIGSEEHTYNTNTWLMETTTEWSKPYIEKYKEENRLFINSGIYGGSYDNIMFFLNECINIINQININEEFTDMQLVTVVTYEKMLDITITGEPIHTRFLGNIKKHPYNWLAHK